MWARCCQTDSMLRFEMHSRTGSGQLTQRDNPPYQRRDDLIDPSDHLDRWAAELRGQSMRISLMRRDALALPHSCCKGRVHCSLSSPDPGILEREIAQHIQSICVMLLVLSGSFQVGKFCCEFNYVLSFSKILMILLIMWISFLLPIVEPVQFTAPRAAPELTRSPWRYRPFPRRINRFEDVMAT
jgi:hypothetical protein